MAIDFQWRGEATSRELNELHAEAFETEVFSDDVWPWTTLLERHSLGWVVAREDGSLVGFVNVLWDGLVHAWIQDTMVADSARHRGVATRLIEVARDGARDAGCEWLHVDFDRHLRPFYFDACGFAPTDAGLIELQEEPSEDDDADAWEQRLAALWASIDDHTRDGVHGPDSTHLVAELPEGSAIAAYERGSAFDSTGALRSRRCRCTDRRSPRVSPQPPAPGRDPAREFAPQPRRGRGERGVAHDGTGCRLGRTRRRRRRVPGAEPGRCRSRTRGRRDRAHRAFEAHDEVPTIAQRLRRGAGRPRVIACLAMDIDVVVIGAGFAGIAAARDLVEAGRSVVVLEAVTASAGAPGGARSPARA